MLQNQESIESSTAVLSFQGANMGKYMGSEANGKLYYVATISPNSLDLGDNAVQTFIHEMSREDEDGWGGSWGAKEEKKKVMDPLI